jgi:hypothetical protein
MLQESSVGAHPEQQFKQYPKVVQVGEVTFATYRELLSTWNNPGKQEKWGESVVFYSSGITLVIYGSISGKDTAADGQLLPVVGARLERGHSTKSNGNGQTPIGHG